MKTISSNPTRRHGAATALVIAFALFASMFVAPGVAGAGELRAAPTDGVAELTPDEWDCVMDYEAVHVMLCLMLKKKPVDGAAATQLYAAPTTRGPNHGGPDTLCPGGTVATPFEQPMYDKNGLFVVDYETVWYCLPVDLEPEG